MPGSRATFQFSPNKYPEIVFTADEADRDLIAQHRWRASRQCDRSPWYGIASAIVGGRRTVILLHRHIIGALPGQIVDHVDRNSLNNTRANLRFCTASQSSCNRVLRSRLGMYRGVFLCKGRWRAVIEYQRKRHGLGSYDTAEEAALAYDEAAVRLHGEFAVTNAEIFPGLLGGTAAVGADRRLDGRPVEGMSMPQGQVARDSAVFNLNETATMRKS